MEIQQSLYKTKIQRSLSLITILFGGQTFLPSLIFVDCMHIYLDLSHLVTHHLLTHLLDFTVVISVKLPLIFSLLGPGFSCLGTSLPIWLPISICCGGTLLMTLLSVHCWSLDSGWCQLIAVGLMRIFPGVLTSFIFGANLIYIWGLWNLWMLLMETYGSTSLRPLNQKEPKVQ